MLNAFTFEALIDNGTEDPPEIVSKKINITQQVKWELTNNSSEKGPVFEIDENGPESVIAVSKHEGETVIKATAVMHTNSSLISGNSKFIVTDPILKDIKIKWNSNNNINPLDCETLLPDTPDIDTCISVPLGTLIDLGLDGIHTDDSKFRAPDLS